MKMRLKIIVLALGLLLHGPLWAAVDTCGAESLLTRIRFQEAVVKNITGVNGVAISTYAFENPTGANAIVLVPGLGDASELLEETIQDFYSAGFSVFILDHRGQGHSKILASQVNSHVDSYENYVADLTTFIDQVVQPKRFAKTFMLGNSMGAAIGLLYLKQNPDVFSKAVFLSPMYGLPIPSAVSNMIARLGASLQGPTGSFLTKFRPSFKKNTLTTDEERFEQYEGFFNTHPEVPGYAPSHNWMMEANKMMREVQNTEAHELTTPIEIYTSGLDKLVNNKKTNQLAARFDNINVTLLPDSKHGPHFERDEIRQPLFLQIVKFFTEN